MQRLRWETDGLDWPNRASSRFVTAGGLSWHVQVMGDGPALLLAHGTGASTHSWRGLAPLLARHFTVVAPDLPGHGFSRAPPPERLSLQGMAAALRDLIVALPVTPEVVVGHSAGAAIMARMRLDGAIQPRLLVSLNGALTSLRGLSGHLFSPMAKVLAINSVAPRLFAWRAGNPGVVESLLRDTGSRIDAEGVALYRRLAANPAHVAAALGMMAQWDLGALERALPRLDTPVLLVAGGADRAIPAAEAFRVRDKVPGAQVEFLRGLGHLAHEEQPGLIAGIIIAAAERARAISADAEATAPA